MKSILCSRYGPPEVLRMADIEKPKPKAGEILVRNAATAVNSADIRIRGLQVGGFMKIVMRIVLGFSGPRRPVLGTIYSGTVEETGAGVTAFKPGDKVYGSTGFRMGTYAEYVIVTPKDAIGRKPAKATFEEAAAMPFGALSAIYFLDKHRDKTKTASKVLIYGATGSVGTAALQVARKYGMDVTAVCSSAGEKLVRDLGVRKIIRYDQTDLRKVTDKFDLIFDAVGKTTRAQVKHMLSDNGKYVTVGGLDVADERTKDLEFLTTLYESGEFKPSIDRVYPMESIIEAHRYVDAGHKKGNVVIRISGPDVVNKHRH